jgi:hypothetical protein
MGWYNTFDYDPVGCVSRLRQTDIGLWVVTTPLIMILWVATPWIMIIWVSDIDIGLDITFDYGSLGCVTNPHMGLLVRTPPWIMVLWVVSDDYGPLGCVIDAHIWAHWSDTTFDYGPLGNVHQHWPIGVPTNIVIGLLVVTTPLIMVLSSAVSL